MGGSGFDSVDRCLGSGSDLHGHLGVLAMSKMGAGDRGARLGKEALRQEHLVAKGIDERIRVELSV